MLPPFPTDDTTLDMLEAAIAPWEHGHPEAVQSSVYPMLEFMSQLGGSDTKAVAEQLDDNMYVMRDPQYTSNCVMLALIAEIRRLRTRADMPERDRQPTGDDDAPRQLHQVPQDIADMLEQAWNIIANVGLHLGGWEAQHVEWVQAAMRWRDEQYFPWLQRHCAR